MHAEIGFDKHVDGAVPQPRRHRQGVECLRIVGGYRHVDMLGHASQPFEPRGAYRWIGHQDVGTHVGHHFGLA